MVMEDNPSPQYVGFEFVRQYYTMLNREPLFVHRFYSNDSSFIHGGLNPGDMNAEPAQGQEEIHRRIVSLNFRDVKTKIFFIDACETLNKGVVIQVIGELSNNGMPMRRFMQTFVLATQAARKYYVRNDIFRYQDEVFNNEDASDSGREDVEDRSSPIDQPTPDIFSIQTKPQPNPIVETEMAPPIVNGHATIVSPVEIPTVPEPAQPIYQRQPTPDVIPQKVVTPIVSPQAAPVQQLPPEEPKFTSIESETGPEAIGSWAADSATQQSETEIQPEVEAASTNEPKTFANLFKSGAHHGLPPTAPPPFSSVNQVTPLTVDSPPAADIASMPPQPQRAARGVRPTRGYRDKEGKADKEPWERPSSRTSNDEVEYRNMNGLGGRLDDRDNKRMGQMKPGGRDWNFQDSHQVFVGNIPPSIVESDLKECFGAIAKVVAVKINSSTRSAANYGFVAFETAEIVQQVLNKRPIYHKSHQFNVEEKTQRSSFSSRTERRDERGPPRGGQRSGSGGPYGGRGRDGENRGMRRDDERGPRREGEDRGPRRDDRGGRMGGRGTDRGGFGAPRR
ncbi:ras GTPase-activating protein-binding protein 1-like [Artemia franciscana]|uniref:Ras GTPase-activating protein-binding protein 1 n=1 Tax=Artemia franciscana TaxID=6661 RepID=A0AA88H8E0_ARTSF|nr:hypothetical protein QYM36_017542 [Artemia franciscana]